MIDQVFRLMQNSDHTENFVALTPALTLGIYLSGMKTTLIATVCILFSSLSVSAVSMFDKVNDFDGDGHADYAVTRNENGLKVWHIWRSTAGYLVVQWGVADDTVNAGDYDGDGRTDPAVTRLTAYVDNRYYYSTFYLASSSGSVGVVEVNAMNAIGSLALYNEDYDGDGKTDPGIFQWHGIGFLVYRMSSTGSQNSVSMGWFQVRVGDVTGDNVADIASYDISTQSLSVAGRNIRWGNGGDRWVAADFDGDNVGEIAIFRASTGEWWWIRSSDSVVNVVRWGIIGDTPVHADYDGDGKTDIAIYRPASPQSTYWVLGSGGQSSAFGFGVSTDAAVTY